MNSEGESCRSGKLYLPSASAAAFAAPQAIQVADRFHVCKNLTEATQLLLARSQAEILAVSQTENEPRLDEPMKQQISIQEWRPPEPASVKKARLARRAGRSARYQQVVEFGQQGMTPKEMARRLGLIPIRTLTYNLAPACMSLLARRKLSI